VWKIRSQIVSAGGGVSDRDKGRERDEEVNAEG